MLKLLMITVGSLLLSSGCAPLSEFDCVDYKTQLLFQDQYYLSEIHKRDLEIIELKSIIQVMDQVCTDYVRQHPEI